MDRDLECAEWSTDLFRLKLWSLWSQRDRGAWKFEMWILFYFSRWLVPVVVHHVIVVRVLVLTGDLKAPHHLHLLEQVFNLSKFFQVLGEEGREHSSPPALQTWWCAPWRPSRWQIPAAEEWSMTHRSCRRCDSLKSKKWNRATTTLVLPTWQKFGWVYRGVDRNSLKVESCSSSVKRQREVNVKQLI